LDSRRISVSIFILRWIQTGNRTGQRLSNSLIPRIMPNTCTNILYLFTSDEKLRDRLVETISRTFNSNDINLIGEDICEMNFDSRWTFPYAEMEDLTKGLPTDNELYIRVLSYEFGCEYIGFNIYANGEWHDRFADK
jgi:hypothetical protein